MPRKTDKLSSHPSYGGIMAAYNDILKRDGKVNNSDFYVQWVAPNIRNYTYSSFCRFILRFKRQADALAPQIVERMNLTDAKAPVAELKNTLVDNATATQRGIAQALNMGMKAIEDIASGNTPISVEKRAAFLFKAMNAQNQRIHAMATIRKDNREEKQFQQSFNDAAYIRPELEDEEVEDLSASLEGIEEEVVEGEIL